jgi:hypothetical protein
VRVGARTFLFDLLPLLESQRRSGAVRSRGPAGLTPWMTRIEHVLCAAANKFLRG